MSAALRARFSHGLASGPPRSGGSSRSRPAAVVLLAPRPRRAPSLHELSRERPQAAWHRRRPADGAWVCASALLPLASVSAATAAGPHHWVAALSGAGIFILCCAAAALLLSAIPLLWSMARTASRMESMLQTIEAELPDTAASVRLSSLELSDCLSELGALGSDLSGGLRASANMLASADTGLRQGTVLVRRSLLPALARRETQMRGALEAALTARAELAPRIPEARALLNATTTNARRLRGALLLSRVAGAAVSLGRSVRNGMAVVAARRLAEQEAVVAAVDAAARRRWRLEQQLAAAAARQAGA